VQRKHQFCVVVVPILGNDGLLRCLKSISNLPVQHVIVAAEIPDKRVTDLIETSSMLLLVRPALSVPERRAVGVEACSCEWVALLEDTCTIEDKWFEAATDNVKNSDCAAFTGPVRFSPSLAPNALALACSEYGRFTRDQLFSGRPNINEGIVCEVKRSVGVNLFYRKTAIESHIRHEGIIESELDQTLTSRGERIVAHRDFAVCFAEADEASMKLRSRFNHGRLYGGFLRRRKSLPARMIHLLRCIALPLVLSQRAIKALPTAHTSRRAAIKHIVIYETSWSIGEFIGILVGPGALRENWK